MMFTPDRSGRKAACALCEVFSERTLKKLAYAVFRIPDRPDQPHLVLNILMVPGYVEAEEVSAVASHLAGLNRNTPHSLPAFQPRHAMRDMPVTTRRQAEECRRAALDSGLIRVHVGSIHLIHWGLPLEVSLKS